MGRLCLAACGLSEAAANMRKRLDQAQALQEPSSREVSAHLAHSQASAHTGPAFASLCHKPSWAGVSPISKRKAAFSEPLQLRTHHRRSRGGTTPENSKNCAILPLLQLLQTEGTHRSREGAQEGCQTKCPRDVRHTATPHTQLASSRRSFSGLSFHNKKLSPTCQAKPVPSGSKADCV